MVILALFSSVSLPGVAYFIIQLQYIYYSKDTNDDWEAEATVFLLLEASWIALVVIVVSIEKALF